MKLKGVNAGEIGGQIRGGKKKSRKGRSAAKRKKIQLKTNIFISSQV